MPRAPTNEGRNSMGSFGTLLFRAVLLLTADPENDGGKTTEDRFFLRNHSIFFRHAARRNVLRMNKGNHMRQSQVIEGVIAHRALLRSPGLGPNT